MILNCDGGDPVRLNSVPLVRRTLDALPRMIEMTKMAPAFSVRWRGNVPENAGVSGFVLIAESHIAIHTFPARRFAWVDVFSCKAFDGNLAERVIRATFGFQQISRGDIPRDLDYPPSVSGAIEVLRRERAEVK